MARQGRAYGREEVETLLRGALTELMADGTPFRDLTVERLVSACGMARSTFYLYFEDKPSMLRALSSATMLRLYAAQRSWLGMGRDVTRDDVRASMLDLLTLFVADEAVMRATAEAAVYDPAIREAYRDGVADYVRAIERFVREGQREGFVRDDVPPAAASALAWMTERTVSQVAPGASRRALASTADGLAAVVAATLLKPARPAARPR